MKLGKWLEQKLNLYNKWSLKKFWQKFIAEIKNVLFKNLSKDKVAKNL